MLLTAYLSKNVMTQIKASDSIKLKYPSDKVWSVISDIQSYKKWWPELVNLEIIQPNSEIVGTILIASPLGGKSFSIKVEDVFPGSEIVLNYFDGIYRGFGKWLIRNDSDCTQLIYEVNLDIVDRFTKILSYLVPVSKIHSLIFKRIFRNLEKYLGEVR